MIDYLWDLVEHNPATLCLDLRLFTTHHSPLTTHHSPLTVVGPANQVVIGPDAVIDPSVVADTRGGPVIIDREAVVHAFTRLEGPCYVGQNSQVLGAKIRSGTTIGPNCRIGGEVEASILHGFSNKYHDGFLGHSYIGEWVNIGAGAHTSDLRHDYGEVLVTIDGLRVPTGSAKVGSFVGDHAKIGIGCLLNSGTIIGAFASILPAGKLLPKNVPSFCAVLHGEVAENDDVEALFATAEEVMRRRGIRLTPARMELYRHIHAQSATDRKRTARDAAFRRMRRSA
jgi:UDP-N-acetylglucosamine diphosphorylase/glucosamine-1-phosphate N-acetyltransferase